MMFSGAPTAAAAVAPRRTARELLASCAAACARAGHWLDPTSRPAARHPLDAWLAQGRRRGWALVVSFALVAVVATSADVLLAGTLPVVPRARLPLLFAGLLATSLVTRRAPARFRRAILLVASLSAAAWLDVVLAAASLAYFTALYAVLVARLPRAAKLGFVGVTYAAAIVAYVAFLPAVSVERHDASFLLYVFVFHYTFRIARLVHALGETPPQPRPRYVDVLLYMMFAPFFVVLPSMTCIPRFDRFVDGLDRPMPDGELSAVRYALAGAAAAGAVLALRHVIDPLAAYAAAKHGHRWTAALLLGVLCDPIWRVLGFAGVAWVLTAMMHLFGIDVAPPIDRPLAAESLLDWWRRWNVHFRDLLVDVFFYPLALRARRPRTAVVLGCAGVFLIGSTGAHWLLAIFRHHAGDGVWPIAGESAATFVTVAALLCVERGRRRPRRSPSPRLADAAVPLSAWARARASRALRVATTMLLVFATTTAAQDAANFLRRTASATTEAP